MPEFHGQADRDSHALAIGRIVMAWNEYHEILGQIYAEACGRDAWEESLRTWHEVRSDFDQRQMLRKIAQTALTVRASDEIVWMLDRTDNLISKQRNVGVHAPLMSFSDLDGKHQMLPQVMYGNRRAAELLGKDILDEYANYEKRIRKLLSFAVNIQFNISPVRLGPQDWSERPEL